MPQLPIMFDDLNEEAQQSVLDFYGYKSSEEGNFDISPLCILEQ